MLRITTSETTEAVRLCLEGRLSGAWVTELDNLYSTRKNEQGAKPVVLDLENLIGVDGAGRYLLALIQCDGAAIENASPLLMPLWTNGKTYTKRNGACK